MPILDIIERHEHPVLARYLRKWLSEAPNTFSVTRDASGAAAGFYCVFDPSAVPRQLLEEDPVTRAWLNYLEEHSIPRQQRILFIRRWLSAETGEAPSPVQAACRVDLKRKYLEFRPSLRRVYLALRDLQPYAAAAQTLGFRILDEAVVVSGEEQHSAMLDFGAGSVDGWLAWWQPNWESTITDCWTMPDES